MSHSYRKCKYISEGEWGSSEEHYVICDENRSNDITTFYDEDGEYLFCSQEWVNNMTKADAIRKLNDYDNACEVMSYDEFNKIINKI